MSFADAITQAVSSATGGIDELLGSFAFGRPTLDPWSQDFFTSGDQPTMENNPLDFSLKPSNPPGSEYETPEQLKSEVQKQAGTNSFGQRFASPGTRGEEVGTTVDPITGNVTTGVIAPPGAPFGGGGNVRGGNQGGGNNNNGRNGGQLNAGASVGVSGHKIASGNKNIRDFINIARRQVGDPYIWGATGPGGFDCSGLIDYSLNQVGVHVPRLTANGLQNRFPKVARKNLKPGDLLYFWFPNSRGLARNQASHVAIFIGHGKMVAASSSAGHVVVQNVYWSSFIGGGRIPQFDRGGGGGSSHHGGHDHHDKHHGGHNGGGNGPSGIPGLTVQQTPASLAPLAALGAQFGTSDMSNAVMTTLPGQNSGRPNDTKKTDQHGSGSGGNGGGGNGGGGGRPDLTGFHGNTKEIERQLIQGFQDAGRDDLARMVRTRDFHTWINAESGWKWNSASYYSPYWNYGLFQFRGHPWMTHYIQQGGLTNGGQWVASPYEQARLVARYFGHLDPSDIRRYATEIRNGSYGGWG